MDDLDELIAANGPGPRECRVGWWLTHGTHPDLARLTAAVEGNGTHTAIAAAFVRRGMLVGNDAVRRHRTGLCRCPR